MHGCVDLSRPAQTWAILAQGCQRIGLPSGAASGRGGRRAARAREGAGGRKGRRGRGAPMLRRCAWCWQGGGGRGGCTVSSRRCRLYVATCSSLRSSARSAVHWRRCAVQRAAQPQNSTCDIRRRLITCIVHDSIQFGSASLACNLRQCRTAFARTCEYLREPTHITVLTAHLPSARNVRLSASTCAGSYMSRQGCFKYSNPSIL